VDVILPPRLFSLREANALLVDLQERFLRVRALRDQLAQAQKTLAGAGHAIEGPELRVDREAPPAVQKTQARAVELLSQLRALLTEVAELGVEVKAADGLCDFRSKLHGRTVYLCWKFGEERITHYHDLEAGFAGRKPLPADGDFLGDLLH
jgi:hypothetical protein